MSGPRQGLSSARDQLLGNQTPRYCLSWGLLGRTHTTVGSVHEHKSSSQVHTPSHTQKKSHLHTQTPILLHRFTYLESLNHTDSCTLLYTQTQTITQTHTQSQTHSYSHTDTCTQLYKLTYPHSFSDIDS